MVELRTWSLFALTLAAAVVTVAALQDVVPRAVSAALYCLVVIGAGLGARYASSRRRRSRRADHPDGVEREHALRAATAALPVNLVISLAIGAWLVMTERFVPAAWIYGAVVATVVTYWIAYARARRQV